MSHIWSLETIHFQNIKNGNKTVEGRIADKKRLQISVGDIVVMSNKDAKEETVDVQITEIVKYNSFKEMISNEGVSNVLPGETTVDNGVAEYHQYYTVEQEKTGVLAFRFSLVDKFKRAQQLMYKYLTSDEFRNREDAESTQSSVSILQKIIHNGYITNNSQEGTIVTSYTDNKYFRMEERAYVSGFMHCDKASKFINYINTYTDKVAFAIFSNPSEDYHTKFKSSDYIPSIALTVFGYSSESPEQIKLTQSMSTRTVLPTSIVEFEKEQVHLNGIKVEYVECFDPRYGRLATAADGLYNDILKALQ